MKVCVCVYLCLLKVKVKSLSRVWLFATPWTVAHQAPLSMGFSRQEYWSQLPFPSPGDLPDPGIKPRSPTWQADSLPSEPTREALKVYELSQLSTLCCKLRQETVSGARGTCTWRNRSTFYRLRDICQMFKRSDVKIKNIYNLCKYRNS